MSSETVTGIFALVGVVLGGLFNVSLTLIAEKKTRKNELTQKQLDICLYLLTELNELINHIPHSEEELDSFYSYLTNKNHTKSTQAEIMLFLPEDISTTFLVAYVFPQDALDNSELSFEEIFTRTCIYRNVLLRAIREELDIKIVDKVTSSQNARFDKYFNEETQKIYADECIE